MWVDHTEPKRKPDYKIVRKLYIKYVITATIPGIAIVGLIYYRLKSYYQSHPEIVKEHHEYVKNFREKQEMTRYSMNYTVNYELLNKFMKWYELMGGKIDLDEIEMNPIKED